jgi:hypothetical protein
MSEQLPVSRTRFLDRRMPPIALPFRHTTLAPLHMNVFKFYHWRGLPEKFGRLELSRALAGVAAPMWGRFSRGGLGANAIPSERGPRAKSTKKNASLRSSSSKTPRSRSRGVAGVLATPFLLVARLLFSDVRLEREGKNVNVKLAAKRPDAQDPAPIDKAMAEALPLRAALKTLLDSHSMTRRVMRHLAFFEGALTVHGLKATAEVPVEVLAVALEQLETLVRNWSNPGLAELRSKMAVAIVDRSRDPFYGSSVAMLSNFNTNSRMAVGDASHSMFLELERQYQDVLPAHSIQAALDPIRVEFAADAPTAPR